MEGAVVSYMKLFKLTEEQTLLKRIAACAATLGETKPLAWAHDRAWQFATRDGWVEAYSSSEATDPGGDEDAITDEMILEAVQALRTA